jgi:hypothetical protein
MKLRDFIRKFDNDEAIDEILSELTEEIKRNIATPLLVVILCNNLEIKYITNLKAQKLR